MTKPDKTRLPIRDQLAAVVTRRSGLVMAVLGLVTLALGMQIPQIEADPAPEKLISSFDSAQTEIRAKFESTFGSNDRVMVVLLEADNVLMRAPLQYVHDLSLHFADQNEWIDRVESVTVTTIPHRAKAGTSEASEDGELDLDSLEDDWEAEDDFDPEITNALVSIIESDPDRFPGGIKELGPKLSAELKTDPIVDGDKVTEGDAAELRHAVASSPIVQGRLVSNDQSVAAVVLFLKDINPRAMRKRISALRAYLNEHQPPAGARVHLGGLAYLRSVIVERMGADQLLLVPLTLLVCVLLLYLSFRWVPGVVLPVVAVAITALMVVGGMALAHEPMNILNNIIPLLLIIIGISDSIHLIGRYREEMARTGDRGKAGIRTVHAMAIACLLTSVTTSVGLASLVVSRTVMLRHFGVIAALGVLAAYVVTITFLPAALVRVKPPTEQVTQHWGAWLEIGIMRLTSWILGRPGAVLSATGASLALCVWGACYVKVDHALLDQFDTDDPVHITTRLIENKLDGVRPLEVIFRSPRTDRFQEPKVLAQVDAVERWAAKQPAVVRTMSQTDVMRQSLYLLSADESVRDEMLRSRDQVDGLRTLLRDQPGDPLSSWTTSDGRQTRLQIKVRDVGAQAIMALVGDLQNRIDKEFASTPDVHTSFTGEAFDGSLGQEAVVSDLLGSLMTAVAVIFVLLALLFRSMRLGLLSIPPNLIPLVGTMAYMVARGIPLNAATVIIFAISLGLAVDGTIHVLARYREETERGLNSNAALIRAARGTGRAIVVSCVTLMAGFAVLLMSSFVPVRRFGELIAVTVGGCLIATLVVQPALLKIAGMSRRNAKKAATKTVNSAARAAGAE